MTQEAADYALSRLEIDELGLDAGDRRLLHTIIQRYDGGPVGIEALAASLAEDRDTLEYPAVRSAATRPRPAPRAAARPPARRTNT